MTKHYTILSTPDCKWCSKAYSLLSSLGHTYTIFNVSRPEHGVLKDFMRSNGLKTVPQVFLNGELVGGYSELAQDLEVLE